MPSGSDKMALISKETAWIVVFEKPIP